MTAKCCQAFTRNQSPRAGRDAMAIEMAASQAGCGRRTSGVRARRPLALHMTSIGDPISDPASRCVVRVVVSREDEQIARHIWELTSKNPA